MSRTASFSKDSKEFSEALLEQLVADLESRGYCILEQALPATLAQALREECCNQQGPHFRPAGTGREQARQLNAEVRSDDISWLEEVSASGKAYLDFMESLRIGLNRHLFLGLFDYECHYARYAPGALYRTHLDAFEGSRNRVLSTVIYLNENWQDAQGGELMLYAPDAHTVLETVVPEHNRLILFLSERFPHEVLPAVRIRYSLTGWFRIRTENSWRRPV